MEYWDKELGDHGDNRRVKGNSVGPFVVLADPNTGDPIGLLDPETGLVSAFLPVGLLDSEQRVPGMVGYTGPIMQAVIKDSTGNEIEFSQVQTHTFHDAAVATADGTVFECDGEYTRLLVEITTADADTQEIDFLGSVEGTNYYPLLGAKVGTDGSITTNVKTTAVTSEMWEIDITNRKYVMMDLATLTGEGATVTVTGVVS